MTPIHAELEKIKDRLKNATPGPWRWVKHHQDKQLLVTQSASNTIICELHYFENRNDNNTEFIANSPTDISRLISALEYVLDVFSNGCYCHKLHPDSGEN